MFRVCCVASFLSIAACISYPEVTLVDGTNDAPLSPDGSAEPIALASDLGLGDGGGSADGGVVPHPERDARADAQATSSGGGGGGDDDDPGNGKGKPPKKKD